MKPTKIKIIEINIVANSRVLKDVCVQMRSDNWGDDNEMTNYRTDKLKTFLETGGLLLLAKDSEKIAGAALCYIMPHPAGEDSLYVHELDTHPDYRRKGIATQLMNRLLEIAKEKGLTEVWVGTETTNKPADALYRSLNPNEIEPSFIYAYRVK